VKRAYFVVGPQSSGTRMMTRALLQASGGYGSSEHNQPMDDLNFEARPETIVFRRSVPHSGRWPDLKRIARRMLSCGYEVKFVRMHRQRNFLVRSQIRVGHVPRESQAHAEIERAGQLMDGQLKDELVVDAPYGIFVTDHEFRAEFFAHLGLHEPAMDFYDGNARYGRQPA